MKSFFRINLHFVVYSADLIICLSFSQGHKKQLEEVWEKEDGLDPDSFDPRTFFNLHGNLNFRGYFHKNVDLII